MAQYINKSAVVAEIEKYIANYTAISVGIDKKGDDWVDSVSMLDAKIDVLQHILYFLNTLEVKEVDLDEEFDEYCETLYLIDLENEPYAELFECAKYFFELGLKVQKGE